LGDLNGRSAVATLKLGEKIELTFENRATDRTDRNSG